MRRTKIVCTMGPSTYHSSVIYRLMEAGMDVARLNLSHETHERHAAVCGLLRQQRERLGKPVAILLDTKGPEVRVGSLSEATELTEGQTVELTAGEIQTGKAIPIRLPQLCLIAREGMEIRINDGMLALAVQKVNSDSLTCKVLTGGELRSNKGVNFPDTDTGLPFLSDRDRFDLDFAMEQQLDFVAASFVRTAEDVIAVKQYLRGRGSHRIKVIAKIENRQSVRNIDSILSFADGVMIARGDLGVEIDYSEIPAIQKSIIKKAYELGKPAITATQMLESMIQNPRPTRAETSDVANAVYDGTSAVMLSGETAAGAYPVEAVRAMAEIARTAEQSIDYEAGLLARPFVHQSGTANAVSHAACVAAVSVGAKAIVSLSDEDMTAAYLAKFRPPCDIYALAKTASSLLHNSLNWGVIPLPVRHGERPMSAAHRALSAAGVRSGDKIVIVEDNGNGAQWEHGLRIVTV